ERAGQSQRSEDPQPRREVGEIVRRLDVCILHQLRRRRVTHTGSYESVDNSNIADEDQHSAYEPRCTGGEHYRLTARLRRHKHKNGHHGEGSEGSIRAREMLGGVPGDVVAALEEDLLDDERADD